jgi:hypothetical protein
MKLFCLYFQIDGIAFVKNYNIIILKMFVTADYLIESLPFCATSLGSDHLSILHESHGNGE